MLEVFESNNSRDFRQRYSGSYGYYTVPESKKRVLVWMSTIGEHDVEFVDENQTRYNAKADTGVEFEFIPVRKKLFVHNDILTLVHRNPARMWSRGVNPQNTRMENVRSGGQLGLSFARVKAAFEDTPNVLQNVKVLEDKKASAVVLSDMFGVFDTSLCLYDHVIGSFMADRKQIKVDEPMFKQEVADLVERYKLPYKVVSND